MRAPTFLVVYSLSVLVSLCGTAARSSAEDVIKKLAVFSDAPLEKGLWRMEILESSNPSLVQQSAKMGKTAICLDVARELSKGEIDEGEGSDCKQSVVKDDAAVAELAVECPDGRTSVTIARENAKAYTFDSKRTGKGGDVESMKGRYTYQGPCKGDALVQMDRDSEACQNMRAQMQGHDPAEMCANVPENRRAQCEEKMKSLVQMCE